MLRAFACGLCVLCLSAQSPDPAATFQQAVAAQNRGDNSLAISLYRQMLQSHPDALPLHVNLGAALASEGRWREAIAEYRTALKQAPDDAAIRMNLALALRESGDARGAIDELSSLAAAELANARVATLLADCKLALGDTAGAIAAALAVEAANPGDLDLSWVLGSALIRANRLEEGVERVDKVSAANHDPSAYLLASETRLKLSQFDLALADADQALQLKPGIAGGHTLRGMILEHLGDFARATAELQIALKQDSKDSNAHLYLGAILYFDRHLEAATDHLHLALRYDPNSALARFELALVERAQDRPSDAVRDLEAVVKSAPDWQQPHIELSALYYRLKRFEDGAREKATVDRLEALRGNASAPLSAPVP